MKLNFWIEPNLSIVLTSSVKADAGLGRNRFVTSKLTSLDTARPDAGRPTTVLEGHSFKKELAILLWRAQLADSLQLQHLWDLSKLQAKASLFLSSPQAMTEYSGELGPAISAQHGAPLTNGLCSGAPHIVDEDFIRSVLKSEAPLINSAFSHILYFISITLLPPTINLLHS